MITARNYVAQAEKVLRTQSLYDEINKPTFLLMADSLAHSVKFAIPDGGLIFDDGLRGLEGVVPRLPFAETTIEFFANGTKNIVLAIKYHDDIVAAALCQSEETGYQWGFLPIVYKIPSEPFSLTNEIYFQPLIPDMWNNYSQEQQENSIETMRGYAWTILELIEALSCKNIKVEPLEIIDPRKNERRIKAGKLPLYETKILTIEAPQQQISKQNLGGSHASPRQHLRRGHIRRLPSGNIWVNSCVVGDPTRGVINKSYAVVDKR